MMDEPQDPVNEAEVADPQGDDAGKRQPPRYESATEASRIYFLPNLMTGGNLFCGFVAMISCIQAKFIARIQDMHTQAAEIAGMHTPAYLYERAVLLILAGVLFDSLDGRLARLGGRESLFGKEFDSLADIVTFGIAPALLVFFLILQPTQEIPVYREIGWLIGFIYLACAAVRLARFNVITSPLLKPDERLPKMDFLGLPVPAAAGTVASLVMVINKLDEMYPDGIPRQLLLLLPPLLLLVAFLMVSTIHYPSFKNIGWKTEMRPRSLILLLIGGYLLWKLDYFAISALFIGYIFYGLFRHMHRRRKGIGPLGAAGE